MRLMQEEARVKARVKALEWAVGEGLTDGYLTVERGPCGFIIHEAGDLDPRSVGLEDVMVAIVQINGFQSEDW